MCPYDKVITMLWKDFSIICGKFPLLSSHSSGIIAADAHASERIVLNTNLINKWNLS